MIEWEDGETTCEPATARPSSPPTSDTASHARSMRRAGRRRVCSNLMDGRNSRALKNGRRSAFVWSIRLSKLRVLTMEPVPWCEV